jgi:hypothetical protein
MGLFLQWELLEQGYLIAFGKLGNLLNATEASSALEIV